MKPRANTPALSPSSVACGAVRFLMKVRWLLLNTAANRSLPYVTVRSNTLVCRSRAMQHSVFLPLRLSKAPALMLTGEQIDIEGNFPIRQQIPSHAVEHVAVDAGDSNSLPAQTAGLPHESVPA